MLTTVVDHNDIRFRPMEPDGGKPCSQVNGSSRQGAGSLQAEGQCQPALDRVLARSGHAVQQWGTATQARYGCSEQASTHALACTVYHEQDRASSYGSEGWGFESLRARPGQRPLTGFGRGLFDLLGSHAGSRAHVSHRAGLGSSTRLQTAYRLPADARTRPSWPATAWTTGSVSWSQGPVTTPTLLKPS
jgi:hypothetical protein